MVERQRQIHLKELYFSIRLFHLTFVRSEIRFTITFASSLVWALHYYL